MSSHSRRLSFTTPIFISFAGILLSFIIIAALVTVIQRNDIIRDYHGINRNFTHNLAVNYTESILHENDYILGRAATYLARDDELNRLVNLDPVQGQQSMMQLLSMMPTVSSLSIADTEGHYMRAPQVVQRQNAPVFDATTRPWFVHQGDAGIFSRYTQPYVDFFTQHQTVTLAKPVISTDGKLKGTLAFHFDLAAMSHTLRQMRPPVQGEFFVVNRQGQALLHSDNGKLFQKVISPQILSGMTAGEGEVFDKGSRTWYYYYSFTNPDWFVIYKVSGHTLSMLAQHESIIISWGFALAGLIIITFGLYLRHASRGILMNIINAIKTGDTNRAPGLEVMLHKAIETNKERERAYVRQATVDSLTGCKNRWAFDTDMTALMAERQPFSLALVDIDNFKSINDTWGHLSGDIVLRNVAREGITILQAHGLSLYRYGGEEFAVIFTAEHIAEASALLELWRINVANRNWREEGLHVTFSAGLGEWHMETLDHLVSSVDEALYKAKRQGKNRILRTTHDA
ncbi:diguanylate cyclase [Kluyvera ascorbata]|uniref:diguanylate cyclase n=1 Tax=Kluyvera ascorbata TaxID=51288 RepID=A0A3N2RQP0_9ENTR|nr:sensor domain-containing diguanylate cyclase [Kluyvera ascorbata]MDU3914244.1 diguanylate cyclase [Kluyvera ascorbata]ROU09739.1 sensor domain-containing diguanylate cyclase [Kluyvera ascorbata]HAT7516430.1 diguanylate cyclase [Kluyvera ascorbata]HDG1664663.1 diguanylate cyclase [Kluyvera ascorbata]HDG1682990.1 diguanylate cyclase [Kluyvera ascorbata]